MPLPPPSWPVFQDESHLRGRAGRKLGTHPAWPAWQASFITGLGFWHSFAVAIAGAMLDRGRERFLF